MGFTGRARARTQNGLGMARDVYRPKSPTQDEQSATCKQYSSPSSRRQGSDVETAPTQTARFQNLVRWAGLVAHLIYTGPTKVAGTLRHAIRQLAFVVSSWTAHEMCLSHCDRHYDFWRDSDRENAEFTQPTYRVQVCKTWFHRDERERMVSLKSRLACNSRSCV